MSATFFRRAVLAVCALGLVSWGSVAHATNGYFTIGYDTQTKGMAGIGVSDNANGPGAIAANPAEGVEAGNLVGGCMDLFVPYRSDTNSGTSGPGHLQSDHFSSGDHIFAVPCFGANRRLDDRTAIGVALYANGGMDTRYGSNMFTPGFGPASSPVGVALQQAFLATNYARTIGGGLTVGVAPVLVLQRMAAYGLQPFQNFSIDPTHVSNSGYSYSYGGGFKVGALWKAQPWLNFGISYQSEMWMTRFHRYAGLLAGHGSFNVPPTLTEGVTVWPVKSLAVSAEHEIIFYGMIPALANNGDRPLTKAQWQLGADNGAGFGWKTMNIFRIGTQWQATPALTLRAGFSHATDFTNNDQLLFNILAPATVKDHLAAGASYKLSDAWTVSAAYVHAFSQSFTGPFVGDSSQSIRLNMSQNEFEAGIKYSW
jgi:long-chain fatty acid transport protein